MNSSLPPDAWSLDLRHKPDFLEAMDRVYAWYEGAMIDRVPVRFTPHNLLKPRGAGRTDRAALKARWLDTGAVLDAFVEGLARQSFLGETFPLYYPNLGPNAYAAFYGSRLEFGEETSWAEPAIAGWRDIGGIAFSRNGYYAKILELTREALDRCPGSFMVGYTDLHPGMDCLAAWRDTQALLMDLYDEPELVKAASLLAEADFHRIYDEYDRILKAESQLSATWMGIPSFGKMHIPSCDFAAMISGEQFEEFCLPLIRGEVRGMTHNIFHIDGPGVARHLDILLGLEEIQAFQWVQGVNDEKPIARWIPLVRKLREHGKSVVLNVEAAEIPLLMEELEPEGIFLCTAAGSEAEQRGILDLLSRWSRKGVAA